MESHVGKAKLQKNYSDLSNNTKYVNQFGSKFYEYAYISRFQESKTPPILKQSTKLQASAICSSNKGQMSVEHQFPEIIGLLICPCF